MFFMIRPLKMVSVKYNYKNIFRKRQVMVNGQWLSQVNGASTKGFILDSETTGLHS